MENKLYEKEFIVYGFFFTVSKPQGVFEMEFYSGDLDIVKRRRKEMNNALKDQVSNLTYCMTQLQIQGYITRIDSLYEVEGKFIGRYIS